MIVYDYAHPAWESLDHYRYRVIFPKLEGLSIFNRDDGRTTVFLYSDAKATCPPSFGQVDVLKIINVRVVWADDLHNESPRHYRGKYLIIPGDLPGLPARDIITALNTCKPQFAVALVY
jgi:hypothetical protein